MLHKKTVPRPLKKYVPSVTLSKPKSNNTLNTTKINSCLWFKKIADKNVKNEAIKEEVNSLKPSDEEILNAVTASFKIKTDETGKIIF